VKEWASTGLLALKMQAGYSPLGLILGDDRQYLRAQ
jgi:hypothetical protein